MINHLLFSIGNFKITVEEVRMKWMEWNISGLFFLKFDIFDWLKKRYIKNKKIISIFFNLNNSNWIRYYQKKETPNVLLQNCLAIFDAF